MSIERVNQGEKLFQLMESKVLAKMAFNPRWPAAILKTFVTPTGMVYQEVLVAGSKDPFKPRGKVIAGVPT